MTSLAQPKQATIVERRPGPRQPTTDLIRVYSAVAIIVTVVLAIVLSVVAGDVRADVTNIGKRTMPQVVATEDLSFALSDMDTQLANALLAGDSSLAELHTFAVDTYEKDRARAGADLQQAAVLAGDDAAALRDVLNQFGQYQSLAGQAMAQDDKGKVLALQRQATDAMHGMLYTARKLTDANKKLLEESYQDRLTASSTARTWLTILGILALAALVHLQVVFRMRMRRRINPAVALATLFAVGLTIGGIAMLNSTSQLLRNAKNDAFRSLTVLGQARAVSYDAHGDESRFLLDPERADSYTNAFADKSRDVADPGNVATDYDASLALLIGKYHVDHDVVRIDGLFGRELFNITFPGEQKAAEQTLDAYRQYHFAHQRMRQMVTDGKLQEAVEYIIKPTGGTSNDLFHRYDKALTDLIAINQQAFDSIIASADTDVAGWTRTIPYGGGVLIVLLIGIGIRPRLAEFH